MNTKKFYVVEFSLVINGHGLLQPRYFWRFDDFTVLLLSRDERNFPVLDARLTASLAIYLASLVPRVYPATSISARKWRRDPAASEQISKMETWGWNSRNGGGSIGRWVVRATVRAEGRKSGVNFENYRAWSWKVALSGAGGYVRRGANRTEDNYGHLKVEMARARDTSRRNSPGNGRLANPVSAAYPRNYPIKRPYL